MTRHELYPNYRDLFEYFGSNEIERIRFRGGQIVRRDWYVFDSPDEAMIFFNERCGALEGRNV